MKFDNSNYPLISFETEITVYILQPVRKSFTSHHKWLQIQEDKFMFLI